MINIKSIWAKIVIYLRPFANWRFLVCFGAAWVITNGIWYVFAYAPINWLPLFLKKFAQLYIIFIWTIGFEKIITIPMSIWFLTKFFKNHNKTREELDRLYKEVKSDWKKFKNKFKKKKGGLK